MNFESLALQEAEQRVNKLVKQLLDHYGFEEEDVRKAVEATGASSAPNAINYLLDNGAEDRGGTVTLQHCPHTDFLAPEKLVAKASLAFGRRCSHGCSGTENWVCLFCGQTSCSRYVRSHALAHYHDTKSKAEHTVSVGELARGVPEALGHHLAISLGDLSVWCYECDAYIDPNSGRNPVVRPLVQRMEELKFGPSATGAEEEELAAPAGGEARVGAPLQGQKDALHGSLGEEVWAPPCMSVVANEAARPGYRTCVAHEYKDAPTVLEAKVKILCRLIRNAKRAVAYTGAGISTASGIADYATKAKRKAPELASPYDAKPTEAHKVLVALHRKGHLDRWVQQNHDGLPQKAGFPQHCLNEIHGAWFDPSNPVVPMDGTLREDLLRQLLEWEEEADLVFALGSTLCGMNADRLCTAAAQRARAGTAGQFGLVIVNLQQTQYDHLCSLRIFATIDDVLVALTREFARTGAALGMPCATPTSPQAGPQGDRFEVLYDESGERGGRSMLDLNPGMKVRFVRQPKWDADRVGTLATVVRRTERGDWELKLLDERGSVRRLGSWWVQAALDGLIDHLPVVNCPSTVESLSREMAGGGGPSQIATASTCDTCDLL